MFQLIRAYFYCFIPLSLFFTVTAAVVAGEYTGDFGTDFLELIIFGTGFIMTANVMKTNPNSGGKQGAYWLLAHLIFMLVSIVVASVSPESNAGGEEELELLQIIGVFAILPLAIAITVFEVAAMIWLFNNSANVPKQTSGDATG